MHITHSILCSCKFKTWSLSLQWEWRRTPALVSPRSYWRPWGQTTWWASIDTLSSLLTLIFAPTFSSFSPGWKEKQSIGIRHACQPTWDLVSWEFGELTIQNYPKIVQMPKKVLGEVEFFLLLPKGSLLPVGVAEATAEPGLNESCTLKMLCMPTSIYVYI